MLVVAQAAQDRAGAQEGQPEPRAQQGQQHFRIEEAGAVEQRKDEIDVRRVEQRIMAVGQLYTHANIAKNITYLYMIYRMVSVIRMESTCP